MQKLRDSEGKFYDNRKYKIMQNKKDIVVSELTSEGFKLTKQRLILLDIILKGECSSCKEIHYKASKLNSSIGIATVYRMINLLEKLGVVSRENMYKFACGDNCCDDIYEIKINDKNVYKLTAKEWSNVLTAGLNACGYMNDSKNTIDSNLCLKE